MVNSVSQHQRGFTLIEMSIVLVIIGLIIGGILKGQELIESSRQKNLISQIDQFKSSTTTFVDRFKGLPGDFSRFQLLPNSVVLAQGGNDNGIVGTDATDASALANLTNAVATGENRGYFNQLLAVGLAGNGSVSNQTAALSCFAGLCATQSPLPSSAFPASGLTIRYGTHQGGTANGAVAQPKRAHWLLLSRFVTGTLAGGTTDGAVSAERAFQLDNKYDDGTAGGGNIRSSFTAGLGTCGGTATDYAATSTAIDCHLLFAVE